MILSVFLIFIKLISCSPLKGLDLDHFKQLNQTTQLDRYVIVTEGAVCSGHFRALRYPKVIPLPSNYWEIDCLSSPFSGSPITNSEFRNGLFLLSGDKGVVGLPVLPFIGYERLEAKRRLPRIPPPVGDEHSKMLAVAASPLTCNVTLDRVRIPSAQFVGQATIFHSQVTESDECKFWEGPGFKAVAIVPYKDANRDKKANFGFIIDQFRTKLTPFADSYKFFAASLRLQGIRAAVIHTKLVLKEKDELSQNAFPFLTSFFMQGIVVALITSDYSIAGRISASRSPLLTVPISQREAAASVALYLQLGETGLLSPTASLLINNFKALLTAPARRAAQPDPSPFFQPLISLLIDGGNDDSRLPTDAGPLIKTLLSHWEEVSSLQPNVPRREARQTLLQNEISIFLPQDESHEFCRTVLCFELPLNASLTPAKFLVS